MSEMKKIKWVNLGEKGKDDFCLQYNDGTLVSWPSEEELEKIMKQYPTLTKEQIEKYYKENPEVAELKEKFIKNKNLYDGNGYVSKSSIFNNFNK